MVKLYVAKLRKFEEDQECPATLVYKHNEEFYDVETKEIYKTQFDMKRIGEIYINTCELIPFDEFFKEYDIDLKNRFSKRKIDKLFNHKSRYTVYFTRLNRAKLFELSEGGIILHSEPANNTIVYQKYDYQMLRDLVTGEYYSTIENVDKVNQKYIGAGQAIKLQKFVNENYCVVQEKIKRLEKTEEKR